MGGVRKMKKLSAVCHSINAKKKDSIQHRHHSQEKRRSGKGGKGTGSSLKKEKGRGGSWRKGGVVLGEVARAVGQGAE